jgi:ribonuclease E
LGTGLIEAFSTPCPHCAGRGILLHGDPVDSTSATGRKSDSGGRRSKRGKKGGKADDVAVAKVPVHPAGEHPMFKAMAAANGRHEDDDDEVEGDDRKAAAEVAELEPDTIREAVVEASDEDLDDDDFDESDEDESDEDESDEDESEDEDIDLDADDEDDDIDDDIEVINRDTDDEDSDEDSDEDDYDDDDEEEEEDDVEDDDVDQDGAFGTEPSVVTAPAGRHRRRAAARPAGPPIHEG